MKTSIIKNKAKQKKNTKLYELNKIKEKMKFLKEEIMVK